MTLDTQLFHFFNGLAGQSPFVDWLIVFFASYLAYILVALFLILVLFSAYSRREKLEILLVVGLSSIIARFGVTETIRFFYHRPRPFSVLPVHQLLTDGAWSFPSGHATFFFALATVAYLYNKKWGIAFFAASLLIGVSRVVAGVHYPSDIIGGALIGGIVGYLVFFIAYRFVPQTLKIDTSTY